MDQSIEQLGQDLARASYAKTTRERYVRTAQELAEHCRKPLIAVTRDDLRVFVESVMSRGMSPWQVRDRLSGMLFLFRRTLGRPELVSFIKLARRHSPLPSVLSLEEVHALLQALRHRRYQAIAMVMYGSGLRVSEAIALEVRDVDGARGVLQVRHGKGDKAREAKLSPSLYEWLRQYWARERPPLPYLFASPKTGASCRASPRCERRSPVRRRRRGSRNGSPLTCCATRLPRTCWTKAPTSMSCVSF
jgi:integrase/recombinase XerD